MASVHVKIDDFNGNFFEEGEAVRTNLTVFDQTRYQVLQVEVPEELLAATQT